MGHPDKLHRKTYIHTDNYTITQSGYYETETVQHFRHVLSVGR